MRLPEFETPRLRLRHFQSADWPAVYAYTSNARVMACMREGQLSEAETRQVVEQHSGDGAEAFPIMLKAEKKLIGHIIFHPWFEPRTHEIGWVLHPDYHRQGYATEMARAVVGYAFETLDSHRVIATCHPENMASYRVMEKLGMRREGHFRQAMLRPNNTWWDEYFYAILEEEWLWHNERG